MNFIKKIKIKNHLLRKGIGVSLIVLGLIAIFVPFVPGWFLIFVGLFLLELGFFQKMTEKIKNKIKK